MSQPFSKTLSEKGQRLQRSRVTPNVSFNFTSTRSTRNSEIYRLLDQRAARTALCQAEALREPLCLAALQGRVDEVDPNHADWGAQGASGVYATE